MLSTEMGRSSHSIAGGRPRRTGHAMMTACTGSFCWVACSRARSALCDEPAEVFVDRNETYMRAGVNDGLRIGMTVTVFGDLIATTKEHRRIGTATVMELWPSLARLNLDEASRAATGKKFAGVEGGGLAAVPPPAPPPAPAPRTPPAPAPPPSRSGQLAGRALYRGVGHWMALQLVNNDPFPWNNCLIELPGRLFYNLSGLRSGDHETIARSNFRQEGRDLDIPVTWVRVTCAEGASTFALPGE